MPDKSDLPPNQPTTPPAPPQADFKEEITSLEFTPPPADKAKKTKIIAGALALFLILISIPAAVIVTRQSQEIRKEAYPPTCQIDENWRCPGPNCDKCGYCDWWGSGCDAFCADRPNDAPCRISPSAPPTGKVECSAGPGGVKVVNRTGQTVSGTVNFFTSKCNDPSCQCGGQMQSASITLGPNQSWNQGIVGAGCAWQSDLEFDGGTGCADAGMGCTGECAPETPTPPSFTLACTTIKAYKTDWSPITNLNTITIGQTVYFATNGATNEPGGLTKARFRINGGSWQETTNKHDGEFYIQYTVPAAGSYLIESMVFNPTLGWK